MIKKIIATLTGWREQRNPSHFEEQDSIERSNAEERRQEAMRHERERIRTQIRERIAPSTEEVLGPSDSGDRNL